MRKILALFGLVILLASCVTTTKKYDPPIENFQGENINTLIKSWGQPNYRVTTLEGHTILSYTKQMYTAPPPSVSPQVGVSNRGGRPVIVVTPPDNHAPLAVTCTVELEANKEGVIIRETVKGSGCGV